MRPIIVILSVFAGASLLGILGALLAIPAAATIQIGLMEWWRVTHPDRPQMSAPPIPPAPPPEAEPAA
jgi:predicted PurR-regulated permease PerM